MRVAWELLLGIFILNISTGLVVGLNAPGTGVSPLTSVDSDEYQSHFNATQIAAGWSSTPFSGIPIIGDIFYGLNVAWQIIQYLVNGFPMFLNWIKDSYIIDSSARTAFDVISGGLTCIFALFTAIMIVEFISGRFMSD